MSIISNRPEGDPFLKLFEPDFAKRPIAFDTLTEEDMHRMAEKN